MKHTFFISVLLFIILLANCEEENFYELLGVSKNSDDREIRKAFKKLAVKLHPDKNAGDENAQAKFILLCKAYETLKDPDARKHYDLYGDIKNDHKFNERQTYQSYQYYQDDFGIYDEDDLIVTLNVHEFEPNINDENLAWFVNFYSPQCWHCHELAPTWRKLAAELEGVIRIAAVNCFEDWGLCNQINIRGYPSLLYYSKDSHLYDGESYEGPKTVEDMEEFILNRLKPYVESLTSDNWNDYKKLDWLLFLCGDTDELCPEKNSILKLSAMLDGLLFVGVVKNNGLCKEISTTYTENPVVYWKGDDEDKTVHLIKGFESQEVIKEVLALLPDMRSLNKEDFQDIRTRLRLGDDEAWLLCFHIGAATELDLQLKRLPSFLPNLNIGKLHCGRNAELCASLHISRYPTWGMLKAGGAFEIHHGKDSLHDIVGFARDSSQAINLHALSPADVKNILDEGQPWFIDWYAPWCPPCQKLMPELRRASQHFSPESVQFGTVDCTLHSHLCSQHGIRSYPTTAFYNGTKKQHFHGRLQEDSIVDFIKDVINPIVISLDGDSFYNRLGKKSANEMWLVEFYAPWCGPCQQFASQYRTLAREMQHVDYLNVADVDCVAEHDLCSSQNIRSYPTIRLFPLGSEGLNTIAIFNGHRDVLHIKKWILGFLPSPVLELGAHEFQHEVLNHYTPDVPWLVDFYAPWCSHCVAFEPEFILVAQKLGPLVHAAKFNCQDHQQMCSSQNVLSYPTVLLYVTSSLHYEIDSQNAQIIIERVKEIISKHKKHEKHDEL